MLAMASPLTPETFSLVRQTRYGSKRGLEPQIMDEAVIFVQPNGSAVREFVYEDRFRGYTSSAISLISEDAVNDIQDFAVLYGGYDRPEQIIFFVNADGTIGWYHTARAEQIRQWGTWETDGQYLSVTVINDKLYALVDRTINGQINTFLERFELTATMDATKYRTNATPQSAWSQAASHLGGGNAQITSGLVAGDADWYLGEYAVEYATGDVDISPHSLDNIALGLPFTQTLEPMPYEVRDQEGISSGMPKRLVSVDVYMASTLALRLNGHRIKTYQAHEDLTLPPTPFTGSQKFYLYGYSERPTVTITNDVPLACEVLAIAAEVEY